MCHQHLVILAFRRRHIIRHNQWLHVMRMDIGIVEIVIVMVGVTHRVILLRGKLLCMSGNVRGGLDGCISIKCEHY